MRRELKTESQSTHFACPEQVEITVDAVAFESSLSSLANERDAGSYHLENSNKSTATDLKANVAALCNSHEATVSHGHGETIAEPIAIPEQIQIKMEPGTEEQQAMFSDDDSDQLRNSHGFADELDDIPQGANKKRTYERVECDICGLIVTKTNLTRHKKLKHIDTDLGQFQCKICHKIFGRKASLRRHSQLSHPNSNITKLPKLLDENIQTIAMQNDDSSQLPDRNGLLDQIDNSPHVESKQKSQERCECDICGLNVSKCNLTRHIKLKHIDTKLGQFQCHICQKVVGRETSLRRHYQWSHPNSNYPKLQCEYCNAVYMVQSSLDTHLRGCRFRIKAERGVASTSNKQNESEFKFECSVCNTWFEKKSHLTGHTQLYHNPSVKKLKCDLCGLATVEEEIFQNHRCKGEKKDEPKEFTCNVCGRVHDSQYKLRYHKQRDHALQTSTCQHCNDTFPTLEALYNHRDVCLMNYYSRTNADRVLECYLCHKISKSKEILRKHVYFIHVYDGKRFRCEPCNRSFYYKSTLLQHQNVIHLNARDYICEACGKSFKSSQQLRHHMYLHTGERPYKCKFEGCGKSFQTSSYKALHFQTVHMQKKRYHCKIDSCGERFGGIIAFKKHQFNVHGVPMTK